MFAFQSDHYGDCARCDRHAPLSALDLCQRCTWTADLNVDAEAGGMLRIALHRMAAKYPFHASLLSAGQFEADPTITTMGVTIRHGRLTFLYAPAFVFACSFEELTGVLHHEINHVLFGHIFDDPAKFPDDEARIISQEVTVNEFVVESLPGRPIRLDQFPQLPPEEDTETRYHRLVGADGKRVQKPSKAGQGVPKNGPSSTKNRPCGTGVTESVQPLDDHGVWQEARKNETLSKMAVGVAVCEARDQLSAEQSDALPDGIRQQIDRAVAGSRAGEATEDVSGTAAPHTIDWRPTLRRFVGRVLEIRPIFNRPPRRFPELVGIIPGQGRRCAKPRIMAVIDTSASLDAVMLRGICRELDRLGRTSEIVVVECDTRIHAVYAYRGPIREVHGRGGTDFRPVFARKFQRKHRPDVVLYFTDGEGTAPSRRPSVPVMWCLTPEGQKPAGWGEVLWLDGGE